VLSALRVKNFILMESLELLLEPGFNALTGETGAGKSIVVGALNLVLGGRARADHVRAGADEAEVSALFDVGTGPRPEGSALARLEADGLLRDGELSIRRVVQASGRSRAYLNGRLCSASELACLAVELADVASQHESVALTDPATHLHYLDRFAGLVGDRNELASAVAELESITRELSDLREQSRQRGEREAFLRFQARAIEEVDPQEGELEELGHERKRLRHAERLLELTRDASVALDQGDGGICDRAARVAADLAKAAELDPELAATWESMNRCTSDLQEIARECTRYVEGLEINPSRLGELEERLYRLEGLMRQHGPGIEEVLEARQRFEVELAELQNTDERIAQRQAERDARLAPVAEQARALSAQRHGAAERLGEAISSELAELGMGGARVLVEVEPLSNTQSVDLTVDGARLHRSGIDRVEFLIAPNRGIDPRPLRKIASGGELSRSLLALKRVLAESGPGLFVFDEVDAGVGGAIAEKIGRAIADVAKHHQVLCITHLAPIAAFANAHYVVSKNDADGIARSAVSPVYREERVHELARMLSGEKVTSAARRAAAELVERAHGAKGSRGEKEPARPRTRPAGKTAKNKRTTPSA